MKKRLCVILIVIALFCCSNSFAFAEPTFQAPPEFNEGIELLKGSNPEQGFQKFQEGAAKNYHQCIAWVGICYLRGWGVEADISKALENLTQASEMGNGRAMAELGYAYALGKFNMPRDISKGLDYLNAGMKAQSPTAYQFAAAAYLKAWTDHQDINKAIEIMKEAENILGSYFDDNEKQKLTLCQSEPSYDGTIDEILKAFHVNEVGANKKYVNKIIQVTGKMKSIKIDYNNSQIIMRLGDTDKLKNTLLLSDMMCILDYDWAYLLADFEENDLVTVKCVVKGYRDRHIGTDRCIVFMK